MLVLGRCEGQGRSERGVATQDVHCLVMELAAGTDIHIYNTRRKLLPNVVFEVTSEAKITLKQLTITG